MKEKCECEMEELESIAQQHAQRADRLDTELTAAREHVEMLKKNVLTLELQTDKDDKIAETIIGLKQDIQQVLARRNPYLFYFARSFSLSVELLFEQLSI